MKGSNNINPFRRVRAFIAQINAAIAGGANAQAALSEIGAYTSRGHGKDKGCIKGVYSLHKGIGHHAPHQGKQEIARRLKRMGTASH